MLVTRLKKVALISSALAAAVIVILALCGKFDTSLGSSRSSLSKKPLHIKEYAVDGTSSGPSRWFESGGYNFKGAPTLSTNVIDHVEKFVFFIGYPRSGHSIVGSLMDAHPHMVIANEFMVFKNWKYYSDKQKESGEINPFYGHKDFLFNLLYKRSYWDTISGLRNEQSKMKNYTLSMGSLWQGKFDEYISIIGDKSGSGACDSYLNSRTTFSRYLEELKTTVKVPLKAVHVVRNPYDQISTCVLYQDYELLADYIQVALKENVQEVSKLKSDKGKTTAVSKYKAAMAALQAQGDIETFSAARYNAKEMLEFCINRLARRASAVTKISALVGSDSVIEIHNSDLVDDPKAAIGLLCSSLEVPCSTDYLQACADKVFKSISRTRDMLVWSPEMKAKVEEVIRPYPFFRRYSFETD